MFEVISILAFIISVLAVVLNVRPNLIRDLMPGAKVAVSIYKHIESGNYIYCRTGSLQGPKHVYVGEGKIDADKAVEC